MRRSQSVEVEGYERETRKPCVSGTAGDSPSPMRCNMTKRHVDRMIIKITNRRQSWGQNNCEYCARDSGVSMLSEAPRLLKIIHTHYSVIILRYCRIYLIGVSVFLQKLSTPIAIGGRPRCEKKNRKYAVLASTIILWIPPISGALQDPAVADRHLFYLAAKTPLFVYHCTRPQLPMKFSFLCCCDGCARLPRRTYSFWNAYSPINCHYYYFIILPSAISPAHQRPVQQRRQSFYRKWNACLFCAWLLLRRGHSCASRI